MLIHQIIEGRADLPILVLLHGRGTDEGDLLGLGPMLYPEGTTVSVRAPFPAAQWGYGGGYAWYRYLHDTTPEPESFSEGQRRLAEFLDLLPGHLGRPNAELIVAGFSQGGTSTLAWGLAHPGQAKALLVFSGFLASHDDVNVTHKAVAGTPIWWGHGTADEAIPFRHAEAGRNALRGVNAKLSVFTDEGAGHGIGPATVASAGEFIRRVVV